MIILKLMNNFNKTPLQMDLKILNKAQRNTYKNQKK